MKVQRPTVLIAVQEVTGPGGPRITIEASGHVSFLLATAAICRALVADLECSPEARTAARALLDVLVGPDGMTKPVFRVVES